LYQKLQFNKYLHSSPLGLGAYHFRQLPFTEGKASPETGRVANKRLNKEPHALLIGINPDELLK
jgi:hypothetical protein